MGGKAIFTCILAVTACTLLAGCGTTDLSGRPDVSADPVVEDPRAEDTAEPEPSCWDRDDDGHMDEVCGGDDCDDDDPSTFPGAPEVCLDGIDQDCDGEEDGLVMMGDVLAITDGEMDSVHPSALWTGSEFVVIWSTRHSRDESKIHSCSIAGDGSGMTEENTISGPTGVWPDAVWTGSEIGVTWQKAYGGVWVTLRPDGTMSGDYLYYSNDTCGSGSGSCLFFPQIAWSGSEYGLAWFSSGIGDVRDGVAFTRASADGHEVGDDSLIAEIDPEWDFADGRLDMTWTGSEFAVVWVFDKERYHTYPMGFFGSEMYLSRLSPDGSKLGEDVLLSEEGRLEISAPDLAWTGSLLGISWLQRGVDNSMFMAVDGEGSRVFGPVEISPYAYYDELYSSSVVWSGSEFAVAWPDCRDYDEFLIFERDDIYLARVSLSGDPLESIYHIHEGPGKSRHPSITWTGSEYGVAWSEEVELAPGTSGQLALHFARIGYCE